MRPLPRIELKTVWQWLREGETVYNRHFVMRVAKRVVYLFVFFNLLYLLAQPLKIGKPTLYNGLFPGRIRMMWTPGGYEALGINELKLSRLFADHIISRPKELDEYRIVFIGSSEIWGYSNRAQDTMPAVLDGMRLSTPDGRVARSYNLSYVYPNAAKDMLILNYALAHGDYEPDLIIWAINPWTVDPLAAEPHWLEMANPELTTEMARQYGLSSAALDQVEAELDPPWWRRHSFLGEREDIAYWLINQFYGLAWKSTDDDIQLPDGASQMSEYWALGQPGVFEALVTMTADYDVSLLLVSPPIAWEPPEYRTWLNSQVEGLDIPLLDCSHMLSDSYFTNTVTHFDVEGHRLFAEQVAAWLKDVWTTSPYNMGIVTTCSPYR